MATPLSAQQLFDALKREGVEPIEYRSWRTHDRDGATGRAFGPVNGVVIHHTAGRDSLALCYNGTSSLPGPLCHTHLAKNGTASMISAGRANHAGSFAQNAHDAVVNESSVHPYPDSSEPVDGNDHYYGIEIENLGNGTDVYPIEQYVKAVKWAAAICRAHGWSHDSVIGHKDGTRRKIDPKGPVEGYGPFDMNDFRDDVAEALSLPAGEWANEEEDVALTTEDIDKVADKVVEKIFKADVIAAVAPPDNNADWDTGNDKWSFGYAVHSPNVVGRETRRLVRELQVKVDALAIGGVDLDALAAKVADLLAARLAS